MHATALAVALVAACSLPETSTATANLNAASVYPLTAGPAGTRYLVDQNGAPFFWTGDAAWSLIAQLTTADATQYLDDRKAKGFDVLLVNLIEHQFATHAPADLAGDAPFPGRPFVAPNEAYFAHADEIIRAAADRGMVVLLAPLNLGYQCGTEGWCNEVIAATPEELHAWGQYVGTRYGAFDNLVWLIGGDMDPTGIQSQVLEVVHGIAETDPRHLMTAHNDQGVTARGRWSTQTWLGIDDVYSYDPTLYVEALAVYETSPTMPFFLIESNYENERATTAQHLRAQAYWTVLSGGMGQIFGNCPIWHFGSAATWCASVDWKGNLNSTGATDVKRFNKLFATRPWHLLVPDIDHTLMTSGIMTGVDVATIALASDGSTALAYLPSSRTVAIDLTKLSGTQVIAWWYVPSTGVATTIGVFPTTGSQTFTPPGAGDWVLVLDDSARGFGTPGAIVFSAPPTVAVPAAASPPEATPRTVSVLGADDGGELGLIYTWSATGPGAATFVPNGTNAAKMSAAMFTAVGTYTVTATITDGDGQSVTSSVDVIVDAMQTTVDTTVTFESLSDNAVLSSYGGITWPAGWRVWDGGTQYTKNAYINSTAKTEVTRTFTLPTNSVLKSLRIAVGSGRTATSIKLGSPGNAEQIYTDINGTYKTKTLGWTTNASVVTVKVTCVTTDGASDLAFDNIIYTTTIGGGPPNQAPTIAVPAAATLGTTTAALSVLGADDGGEPALTYTWTATMVPSGGAATFAPNGTNAAKATAATFTKAGTYVLTAAVRDAGGLAATSSVTVTVQPMLTAIVVTPATATVAPDATQTFTATPTDQFGAAVATTVSWATSGGGTISTAGVFTAGSTAGGPFTVTATSGTVTGMASVTVVVVNQPPAIALPAAATLDTTTAALSVLGADDGGEPALTYTWAATTVPSGGAATFAPNGTNAAKATTATLTRAGTYTLTATVRDAGGLAATSTVTVTVQPTLTSIVVTPATATVAVLGTRIFGAAGRDQFGANLAITPTWSVGGGGTISTAGVFTAGSTPGGPFTVTATSGEITGTAAVTVSAVIDIVVDFETLSDYAQLTTYGGITWGANWRVWAGGSVYTKNAYINSTAKTEVTGTFTLPAGRVLKSMRIAVGSGGTAISVKLSSPGNADLVYTDINGTYKTKITGWTTASQTITVKVTCTTTDGASDLAFDTITYGAP